MKAVGTDLTKAQLARGTSISGQTSRFSGVHLQWPVDRLGRPFSVRVVEPSHYAPATHSELFNAVITELLTPGPKPIDPFDRSTMQGETEHFDLITFPEPSLR